MKPRDALSREIVKLLERNGGDRVATLWQIRSRVNALSRATAPGEVLTLAYLKQRLSYDPVTGLFTWLKARADRVGKAIYGRSSSPYVYIMLDGRNYLAHILAVFYMTGQWPPHSVDHENGLGKDNRWVNLRPATQSQNMANADFKTKNNGLPRGVSDRGRGRLRYRVAIKVRGKQIRVGDYRTVEAAGEAYIAAAKLHFGEFAFCNRSG